MKYFLPEARKQIADAVAEIIGVASNDVSVIDANEKFDADLAVPVFAFAPKLSKSPNEIAEDVASKLFLPDTDILQSSEAVSGFVNIKLRPQKIAGSLAGVEDWFAYGNNDHFKDQEVLVEHTDLNPFKELHIGHLYTNTVGESLAKLHEAAGAHVHRISYHGDVGMHVAKAMWGIINELNGEKITTVAESDRAHFLGRCYAKGAAAFKNDKTAKAEIEALNKKIYDSEDKELKEIYEIGKRWSFDYFDSVYARLNSVFERQYFESDTAKIGIKLVKDNTPGVFTESDGAIVFEGEDHGEHTRVFINSKGLPTYEAKDLGLMKMKEVDYPGAKLSIIVTAEEQAAYFRVMLKAMEQIEPALASKTRHLAHGEVRLPSGKMGSRTGNVVTGVEMLDMIEAAVTERAPDSPAHKENALAALKYALLKQNIGGNIIYDVEDSISLEGQTGPYIQYAAVRVKSILQKVEAEDDWGDYDWSAEHNVMFLLAKYPEVVESATVSLEPHTLAQFLYDIAREMNRYYENVNVKDAPDDARAARIFMLKAVRSVLRHGLNILNITVPEKM